jgi:hypothetical protein
VKLSVEPASNDPSNPKIIQDIISFALVLVTMLLLFKLRSNKKSQRLNNKN